MTHVAGYCPMGCGSTLFLGNGGHVTCSLLGCPDPTAASRLLDTQETEHVVELGDEGFTVQHPLRERVDGIGGLLECDLHDWLRERGGPPAQPGRYRVRLDRGTWTFERLEASA